MTPAQWEQVKEWFDRLADLAPDERKAPLAQIADPVVAAEVTRLLDIHAADCPEVEKLKPPVDWVQEAVELRAFRPGDLAAGRFRIERFLAAGGMGEVYEAEDLELQERVAVKTLRPELALTGSAFSRFKQEIQLSRKVTHPNVCRIHDLWQHTRPGGRTTHFLTMELLQGETLAARLERDGPISPAEALVIVRQMVAGLEAAHAAGVIHRDLKPGNVMITPSRVVITDFGLSRSLTTAGATITGSTLGTPAYMAPEQIEGAETGPATDIYSLGVVLYEMITGALPFRGGSPMAMAVKKLRETPAPPSSHRDGIPARWDRAILLCLTQEPRRRFATPAALLAELEGQTQTPLPARPRPLPPWLPKAALALLAIVVVAFLVRMIWSPYRANPEALRWYANGVSALQEESPYKARLLLEKCVAADPRFAAGHARLAQALLDLDMPDRARQELLLAADLASRSDTEVDAIRKLVLRDFPGAAVLFQKLGDDTGNRLETGRALALARDFDGASLRLSAVLRAEPENPAAHLQLGNVQEQQRKNAEALASYSRAAEVFRLRGNLEGLTAATLRRAELLFLSKDLAQSESELNSVLAMARATGNFYLEAETIGRLSKAAALAGRFPEARANAERVNDLARTHQFANLRARGFYDLGFAYLAQFRYEEAEPIFRKSLEIAEESNLPFAAASARLGLAQTLIRQSRSPEAMPVLNAAADYFRTANYRENALKARLIRVDARIDEGGNDEAYDEARACLAEARLLGSPDEVISTALRVGHMAIVRGDFPASFAVHQEARTFYTATGRHSQFLRSMLNEAHLRISAGDLAEAARLLNEAKDRLPSADKTALSRWHSVCSHLAAVSGNGAEALAEARLANEESPGQQSLLLARALLAGGKPAEAERAALSALHAFPAKGAAAERAEAQLAIAAALLAQSAALPAAKAAQAVVDDEGAQQFTRYFASVVARAALEKASDARAYTVLQTERQMLERLTRTWAPEARTRFLARPDFRAYR